MRRSFRLGFLALFACSSSAATTIAVTLGEETDTITRAPAVTAFDIHAVDRAGNTQELADGSWQSDATIQLADLSQSATASIQLTATQADGSTVVWGAVPFATLGALDGFTIPLFIQRKGDIARMPGTTEAGAAPFLATTSRAVYIAGDGTNIAGYDMLFLQAFDPCPVTAATKSFALVISPTANTDGEQAMAWRISDDGASVFGLAQCTGDYGKNVHPEDGGAAFSDFAGGRTVMNGAGPFSTAYVVGPSRTNAPSGYVFKIAPDSEASTAVDAIISTISITPRRGAATAWSPGHGLFIYGGSSAAPNVVGEIVTESKDGTNGTIDIMNPTDAATDTREGLAAIAIDNDKMLVAGDDQQPIVIDLACPGCAPKPFGQATGAKLTSPSLFALGSGAFLLVGDDSTTGTTRVFRLSDSDAGPQEKILKNARKGARAIQFETGQIVFIGGGSATPESYVD